MLTPLKLAGAAACVLLLTGVACRRRKAWHIALMVGAMTIDVSVLAYIEITRDALATARNKMGPLMAVHIAMSVVVLVLYAVQVVTGISNARGRRSRLHGRVMFPLLAIRLGNLVTSFFIT